ncbi:IGR protein motif-domain-containing protein [Astrocystis sublimbata]|nr:IGR protein motif-domain-containing protein [Astrocystis sublimbata]
MASLRPLLRPQHLRGVLKSPALPRPHAILQSPIRSATATRAASTTHSAKQKTIPQVPTPTPLVPDVETFLSVIGRDLKQHAAKIPDWESLFTLTSEQLRELGVEPPRARKYLIRWCQRFREGQYGIGGDLQHVDQGVAELRVVEENLVPGSDVTRMPRKFVVNIPAGRTLKECQPDELSRVQGYHVQGAKSIVGPYALPLKDDQGGAARVTVTDGMWEDRRGYKIDGGERRRTEVRYKRRIAERREARERGEM